MRSVIAASVLGDEGKDSKRIIEQGMTVETQEVEKVAEDDDVGQGMLFPAIVV